MKKTDWP